MKEKLNAGHSKYAKDVLSIQQRRLVISEESNRRVHTGFLVENSMAQDISWKDYSPLACRKILVSWNPTVHYCTQKPYMRPYPYEAQWLLYVPPALT
jgi:hypothetical protein